MNTQKTEERGDWVEPVGSLVAEVDAAAAEGAEEEALALALVALAEVGAKARAVEARAREILARYPGAARSATLPLLHLVQEVCGWVSQDWMRWVARLTGSEPVEVLGVVTFYPLFRQTPPGRRTVRVCRTLSCALRGAEATMCALEREFGCRRGETSAGGAVTLEFCECLANCGSGPNVQTDDALHENVSPEAAVALAAEVRASLAVPDGGALAGTRAPVPGSPEWNR